MEIRYVTPGYFELMGIPVKRGRAFTERDAASSAPVAIVSEQVVRRWWPSGESIGDRVIIGRIGNRDYRINDSSREVIGIAGDTKAWNVKDPPRPTLYIPIAQLPAGLIPGRMAWVLETTNTPGSVDAARRALALEVPLNEIGPFRTVDDLVASNLGNWRFNAWLFGLFAAVAVALSAIGIFGLLSYTVAQRRREIGMRMALGASRMDVLKLVLGHGVALVSIGLVLGIGGALFATRLLATFLYRIRPNDPFSYVAVVSVLLVVGFLASYIPARRATKIDPMKALRV
jgi:predicted permease